MPYNPDNIFAAILRGDIACVKVFEDDKTLAFLDVMPQAEGHTLVVPREAAQNVLDLSPEGMVAMMATTQKVARAIDAALQPDGIILTQFNGAAAGQSVFHVHFHIIPRRSGNVLAPHARGMVDAKILEPVAAKIRSKL
jgi:histidine triad (HIT) family protein